LYRSVVQPPPGRRGPEGGVSNVCDGKDVLREHLSLDTQIEIAKLTVQEQLQLFRQKGFDNLDVHANAVEFLVRNGFLSEHGQ
jgi:hypothetical protein